MSASVRTLTADLMLGAYASGIFPMAENRRSTEVFWLDPKRRGVFPLEDFHLSRSLQRKMRRGGYVTQINGDFSSVVDACADREETWINPMLRGIYLELHRTEHAHPGRRPAASTAPPRPNAVRRPAHAFERGTARRTLRHDGYPRM